MLRDRGLDLVRIDLEAGHRDHVLLAVHDACVALLVHDADVAGPKEPIGRHRIARLVGLAPVPQHDLRPANPDLATFSERHLVAGIVQDRDVRRRQRQPDGTRIRGGIGGIDRRHRRRLGQAVALDQRPARDLQPAFGHLLLHGHPAAQRQPQAREIQARKVLVVRQRVEQRIDAGKHIHRRLAPRIDERRLVARIDDEHVAHARVQGIKTAHRHGEHVIERQRADDGELLVRHVVHDRLRDRLGLQHVGHQVAVRQHGALGHAGGAARVLQHRHVVHRDGRRIERQVRTLVQQLGQRQRAVDLPRRHDLLDVARGQVDQRRLQAAKQIAGPRHDDVLEFAAIGDLLQGMRKVFQDDDDGRAAVQQLALQFIGGVERIDVHQRHARAQRSQHAHQIGRHVGHHQCDPRALFKVQPLQPGRERARVPVQLRIGDVAAHRRAGDARRVPLAGPVQQVGQRGIFLGGDLRRNALGILSKPRTRHGICLH